MWHVCMHACTYVSMHACMHVCMHANAGYVCVYVRVSVGGRCSVVGVGVGVYVCVRLCACCMYMNIHACGYVYAEK